MTPILVILVTVASTLCLGSIFILYRYAEPSSSHRSLMVLIAMWLFIVVYGAARIAANGIATGGDITVLNINLLMRSYISIFPSIFYIISIFDERVLRWRNMAVVLAPAAVVTALYFGWHLVSGEPYDVVYHSFSELFVSCSSPLVILRLVMLVMIMLYVYGAVRFIWLLADRFEGRGSVNLQWVKMSAISLICISLAYLVNLLFHSGISVFIYIVVGIIAFTFLVDNAMFHKQFVLPSHISVEWRFPAQWRLVEGVVDECDTEVDSTISTFDLFNQWLNDSKPYCRNNFSIKDVESYFSVDECDEIARAIKSMGCNFQSYIRKVRVNEAIQIMNSRSDVTATQLSEMVGFSHISSFSRAFHAVTNKTPREYREG